VELMLKLKIIIFILIIIAILIASFQFRYFIKQGCYIAKYKLSEKSIQSLLESSDIDLETKNFLTLTQEIRDFAFNEIGLTRNKNFTSIIKTPYNFLHYLITICEEDNFNVLNRKYILFGEFPYKAFFEKDDIMKEAEHYKQLGYDVHIRTVNAFSFLGILSDPLYFYMKEYSPYSLASIMIHEQTHATVFIKNNVQFNEEFASFVEQEGALRFIEHKYGKNSKESKDAKIQIKDRKAFNSFFRNLYNDLADIYKTLPTKEERLLQKEAIINKYKQNFKKDYYKYFSSDSFWGFEQRDWNNAMIMGFMHYVEKENVFYELLKKNNDNLEKTVLQIKNISDKRRGRWHRPANPYDELMRLLEQTSPIIENK